MTNYKTEMIQIETSSTQATKLECPICNDPIKPGQYVVQVIKGQIVTDSEIVTDSGEPELEVTVNEHTVMHQFCFNRNNR